MSSLTKLVAPYAHLHARPAGPGDARPTALQIIEDESLVDSWPDRVIIVTGASSGIGLETARALYATGATVYLAVRSQSKGEKAKASILKNSSAQGQIRILEVSLDDCASVREAVATFLAQSDRLDILINNAGVTTETFQTTIDGFELQFGTNHLGHFLLTSLLLPTIVKSATPNRASRIINVASASHNMYADSQIDLTDIDWSKRGYDPLKAYGAAKTANILHANYLNRLYGSDPENPVHALSLHPGAIMTALLASSSKEAQATFEMYRDFFKSPEQGAATTIWCATAKQLEGKGGLYCEDCGLAEPAKIIDGERRRDAGYAPWAQGDYAAEEALWKLSTKLVGL
ncbi:short-chain dehydrogenase/reductase-like protein [Pyrenochaeta sp. MPI-SDFR-AT-0127]|nr:short-chain dehydrogenase/reductase-like protein [Pyrenochaeta sp. MPI-SDFR-AT-0127]